MKVTINGTTYTEIKNLSYKPETDVVGNTVAINEFDVDIFTDDSIAIGQFAYLYDDLNNLWAKFWIIYAERTNEFAVRVTAQSTLKLLERRIMQPVYYENESVSNILTDIFSTLGAGSYTMDAGFSGETITGFCPEQSAKNRLQWLCLVLCAYVKSYFSETIDILPISQSETLIPMEKTFWKPSMTYKDYVTAVNVTAYSFTPGTPSTTDKWVSDGTNTYIVSTQIFRLENPDAPAAAPENEVSIADVSIVNADNVSAILTNLSLYYFKRQELDIDVINNGDYLPGEKVIVYASDSTMADGYIESASFRFGVQARSTIHMTPVEDREAAVLAITCLYNDMIISTANYLLPVGYVFSIQNMYFDYSVGRHRYILRPTTASVSGTIAQGGNTATVNYEVALDRVKIKDSWTEVRIVAVDEAEQEEDTVTIT